MLSMYLLPYFSSHHIFVYFLNCYCTLSSSTVFNTSCHFNYNFPFYLCYKYYTDKIILLHNSYSMSYDYQNTTTDNNGYLISLRLMYKLSDKPYV